MDIKEILEWIKKQQNGQTYLDALNAHLNSLATASKADKDTIKRLQDEAKENKTKLDNANSKVEKFADALGVSEDSEKLDEDIEAALKNKGVNGDPALERKVQRLTKQLNDTKNSLTEQLNAERTKRHDSMIRSALLTELTSQNAVDPKTLVDMFRNNIKVGEDDSLTFGDKSVKDGVSEWLKAHPAFVSNKQVGGAGGNGGGGGGATDSVLEAAKNMGKAAAAPKTDPAALYFK